MMIAACVLGCSAPPRPQVLFFIDVDAPVVGQLDADATLSPDAAVDSVIVEVLDPDNALLPVDGSAFVALEARNMPLSFGLLAPEGGEAWLRVRVFRGMFSVGDAEIPGGRRPMPEVTIDRLLRMALPSDDTIERRRVVMHGACLGVPARFYPEPSSCIDGTLAPADQGIEVIDDAPATIAGSWPDAREVPCTAVPPPNALCVPGGLSIVGDPLLEGVEDFGRLPSTPLRAALVSPYFLDRTEYTVGRFRELLARDDVDGMRPVERDPADELNQFCNWTVAPSGRDDHPLNCASRALAERICSAENASLPSEVQWEHAARGRGRRLVYPWGDAFPTCCAASLERWTTMNVTGKCDRAGMGTEPVASHADASVCDGIADRSIDGILDLTGSVDELVLGGARPYDHPCWGGLGISRDPFCDDATLPMVRGSEWSASFDTAVSAMRELIGNESPTTGIRCAYREATP